MSPINRLEQPETDKTVKTVAISVLKLKFAINAEFAIRTGTV
jgi:hypothetical protein